MLILLIEEGGEATVEAVATPIILALNNPQYQPHYPPLPLPQVTITHKKPQWDQAEAEEEEEVVLEEEVKKAVFLTNGKPQAQLKQFWVGCFKE